MNRSAYSLGRTLELGDGRDDLLPEGFQRPYLVNVGHVEDEVLYARFGHLTAHLYHLIRRHTLGTELDRSQARLLYLIVITPDVLAVALEHVELVADLLHPAVGKEVASVRVLGDQPERLAL